MPAAGIEFFISTPNTGNVDSGVSSDFEPITFDLGQFDLNPDAPDTVWLGEPATQTGDYAAFCTANEEPIADLPTRRSSPERGRSSVSRSTSTAATTSSVAGIGSVSPCRVRRPTIPLAASSSSPPPAAVRPRTPAGGADHQRFQAIA